MKDENYRGTPEAAFAAKESGTGRKGSKYGIEDYVEMKYLCPAGLEKQSRQPETIPEIIR
jgi:hypothetical protein